MNAHAPRAVELDGRSRHVNNLYPIRSISHRIATGLAEFARALVDLVDRKVIRLFTRRDEVLAARIDPDAARLRLGREVGHVGELAGSGSHGEQGDFAGGTFGRIQKVAVGRDLDVSRPDFWLLILRRHRGGGRLYSAD